MPFYLHVLRQCLRQMRSRYLEQATHLELPWSRRGRVAPQPEARRALEWQRVDALLESLRQLEV